MRYPIIALSLLLWTATPAMAEVRIGVSLPGVSLGINLPLFPRLVRVPGYPVYYAPQLDANFFFYDGLYWVYEGDNWYSSTWYNGPWDAIGPERVPLFVLRIPVRYYRAPPAYFRGWRDDAPPRWGQQWGDDWEQRHRGWNRWNRTAAPKPAPLPVYQRPYAGERYPEREQQQDMHHRNYRYHPRDPVVRSDNPPQTGQTMPALQQDHPHGPPPQRGVPAAPVNAVPPPQRPNEEVHRPGPPPAAAQARPREQEVWQRGPERQAQPMPGRDQEGAPQGRGGPREQGRGHGRGQGQDHDRGEERGPERNR